MISQISNIKTLFNNFEDYLKTDVELTKLKAVDKSSDIFSSIVSAIVIFSAVILFIFILSLALSFYIGHLLGRTEAGFFIIAGVWGIILIILYLIRNRWPKIPARDEFIKKILD
jgi:hypothetical protein